MKNVVNDVMTINKSQILPTKRCKGVPLVAINSHKPMTAAGMTV